MWTLTAQLSFSGLFSHPIDTAFTLSYAERFLLLLALQPFVLFFLHVPKFCRVFRLGQFIISVQRLYRDRK